MIDANSADVLPSKDETDLYLSVIHGKSYLVYLPDVVNTRLHLRLGYCG